MEIGWKNRENLYDDYELQKRRITVYLNGNINYSLQDLKNILVQKFLEGETKQSVHEIFKHCLCHIGYNTGVNRVTVDKIIDKFVDSNKNPCTFWDFAKTLRKKGHLLKLYILTTEMNRTVLSVSSKEVVKSTDPLDTPAKNFKGNIFSNNKKEESLINPTIMPEGKFYSNEYENENKFTRDSHELVINSAGKLSQKSNKENFSFTKPENHDKVYSEKSKFSNHSSMSLKRTDSSQTFSNNSLMNRNLGKFYNGPKLTPKISSTISSSSKQELNASIRHDLTIEHKTIDSFEKQSDSTKPTEKFKAQKDKLSALGKRAQIIDENDVKLSNIVLGSGGQGIVVKGTWHSADVAIKSMEIDKDEKLILREISLLQKIGHPNLIQLFAIYPSEDKYNLVMEYFYSNSLYDVIHKERIRKKYDLKPENKKLISKQICEAINYLHKQLASPIIHRDIKPSNVLVSTSYQVKVCDLGLSKCKAVQPHLMTSRSGIIRGTYPYMAPEMVLHNSDATFPTDVWAVACTLVELYNEKSIWDFSKCNNDVYGHLKKLFLQTIPECQDLPFYMKNVIERSFNYSPLCRPEIDSILRAFKD